MKQRRKQPEVTRQAIMAAAGEEFSQHGYAGSRLGAIVARAGLTKGGLFHHFPDKRALAKAWMEECLAPGIEELWVLPLAETDSLAGLKRVCRARIETLEATDATSTLAALATELGKEDAELAAILAAIFAGWRAAVSGVFERGRTAGGIFPAVKPAAEASLLVALVIGIAVQNLAPQDGSVRQVCLTSLEDYLDTLRSGA
ncbi:MAG: TetR/AcrR family transcriptional regulator [Akkermansiaceae bacterium]|nr:TetR/AcrR family transcriptional regulator [Akkermansiaceae bacterium]MCF7734144.1 TetR/AcrR family transcriptional regulator [Akkermansiaceae bacterium]